ncbi:BspA family leucine-rich repeat surface protein [Enterococcus faecalis]|uniref:immunoglobulin-like domain-containing protein n=2 Tax=Enterococcus faecalis TaxID=1351 RepID=UPI002090B767|nr:immunoglobulin-like domain-containing protein [Enterococcus faecalis]MCO5432948.1 BspA family leucine-rich repeat surface protein [Enterococcus faecalis]
MSKKKLTKKKKKQLLAIFATTTMTVNMAMAPLSVLAEQNETLEGDSVENVLKENMDLPAETMVNDADTEKELSDTEKPAEEKAVKTSDSTIAEKEAMEEQNTENETKEGTLTGSYDDGGTWTFNQENGVLLLSGGTLSASIGEASWLKEIKKGDILEIQVVDAVGSEDLSELFFSYTRTKNITFDNFDTSNVTNMSAMFSFTDSLEEVDISSFDTSNVTDMSKMFNHYYLNANVISKITFGNIDTSNVTDMIYMFKNCGRLTDLDVSNFDTSNVTKMSNMFSGCSSLTDLDVSNFDTSNVTDMSVMFSGCSSLTDLDVSDFDTSNVTDMSNMFNNCSSLTDLDVSNFDTSNVTDMSVMFSDCSSLTNLNLSNFDMSNVRATNIMFFGMDNLTKLTLGPETKILKNNGLKKLKENTFWHGEYAGNLLNTTDELIEYHNALNEINTYTIINKGEESLALSFDTVGGSEISPIETNFGDTWAPPTVPTKEGYVFEGWYTDAEYSKEFDFGRAAIEPLTVYAKWAEEKEATVFEVDDYHIGDYNITGRFSAPIVTAQLRINGNISNKGGTFNQNDGTFYYYAGAGRIQTGQEVVLEGLDKAGNIVETVNIEPKVVEGTLSDVQHTVGSSTITGTYTGDMSKARLVVNGNIISAGGTFKEGNFSYYVAPNQVKETDTVHLQGYDKEGNPVGDLTPVTLQKQQGQLTEADYKLGQSTITGTYEGNVKKARLLVDGKQISWGGTFKEGNFSYYVAPGTIKANSTVELAVYGEGDVLLSQENFSVAVQP